MPKLNIIIAGGQVAGIQSDDPAFFENVEVRSVDFDDLDLPRSIPRTPIAHQSNGHYGDEALVRPLKVEASTFDIASDAEPGSR